MFCRIRKKFFVFTFTAPIIVFSSGCTSGELIEFKDFSDDQFMEAVFRYQFKFNRSSIKSSADVYCLKLNGYSLEPQFLNRFKSNLPEVVSGEKCDEFENPLVFNIKEVRVVSAAKRIVIGGYFENFSSSDENRYTVVKAKNGIWKVTKRQTIWVS